MDIPGNASSFSKISKTHGCPRWLLIPNIKLKSSALVYTAIFLEDLAQAQMKSFFPSCIGAVYRFSWILEFSWVSAQQIYRANLQLSCITKLRRMSGTGSKHDIRYKLKAPVSPSGSRLLFPCLGIRRHAENTKPCQEVIDESFPVWFHSGSTTPGYDLHVSASAVSLPRLYT